MIPAEVVFHKRVVRIASMWGMINAEILLVH